MSDRILPRLTTAPVTAGSLSRFAKPRPRDDLKSLTLTELSGELLARLTAGEVFNGSDELLLAERLTQHLATTIDVHLNRFAARRYRDLLTPILATLNLSKLQGATIVDLGCGSVNPFTFSFLLLMLGAERAYAVDLEPIQDLGMATRALATAAGWMLLNPKQVLGADITTPIDVLGNLHDFELPLLADGDPAGVAADRLLHVRESVYELSVRDEEADAVFSVSLLEHLDRVDDALESLRRITKPGGVGIHVVDFVDHRIYSGATANWFEFLKEPSAASLVHGCNRMRCDELCAAFAQHGFIVERADRWGHLPPPTAEERAQFVEPYRSMRPENVATTGVRIVARRL